MTSDPAGGAGPGRGAEERLAELEERLGAIRARVARACAEAGRPLDQICLVVVTKTFPLSDVRLLRALGVGDLGESREQELRAKATSLVGAEGAAPHWHFVGRLQRNKARSVGRLASSVHSVDDERLVPLLAAGAAERDRRLGCFVQVSLDDAPARGGVRPEDVVALADRVVDTEPLALRGVMAVAPRGADPDTAFGRLRDVAERLTARYSAATAISAGMSGDLEAAVRQGATHLRVGSAILGSRPLVG